MSFIAEFLDLMTDEIVAIPGTRDGFGDFVPSGQVISIPCYIEGTTRLVRNNLGQEVVSSFQAYLNGFYNLSTQGFQFTIPSRYDPSTSMQAVSIQKSVDEEGPSFEVVFFP